MGVVENNLGEEIGDRDELQARVLDELTRLRGSLGRLTVQKFSKFPTLRRVCGGGDLLDALLMFEREMRRYRETAGRNEAAAAISITAPADTVLDRLEHVVGALPQDGELRDQRSARRWSDSGLPTLAEDLVYFAEVQGRLGQELLNIEATGTLEAGLRLTIDQMTTNGLPDRAPLIRAWHYPDNSDEPHEREATVDLEEFLSAITSNEAHQMKRYHVHLDFPHMREELSRDEEKIMSVSIEGRDAPMRTVSINDSTELPRGLRLESTVYRTIVMIDVVRAALTT